MAERQPDVKVEAMKVAGRCGAVEIEISGEPVAQFYCHCDDCQVVHGGAYVPESVYAADAVRSRWPGL